jgi:hypothetical protein
MIDYAQIADLEAAASQIGEAGWSLLITASNIFHTSLSQEAANCRILQFFQNLRRIWQKWLSCRTQPQAGVAVIGANPESLFAVAAVDYTCPDKGRESCLRILLRACCMAGHRGMYSE